MKRSSYQPIQRSTGHATCSSDLRQDSYGLYSTPLEDIFLNEKHAIFLKIFNFETLLTQFF